MLHYIPPASSSLIDQLRHTFLKAVPKPDISLHLEPYFRETGLQEITHINHTDTLKDPEAIMNIFWPPFITNPALESRIITQEDLDRWRTTLASASRDHQLESRIPITIIKGIVRK